MSSDTTMTTMSCSCYDSIDSQSAAVPRLTERWAPVAAAGRARRSVLYMRYMRYCSSRGAPWRPCLHYMYRFHPGPLRPGGFSLRLSCLGTCCFSPYHVCPRVLLPLCPCFSHRHLCLLSRLLDRGEFAKKVSGSEAEVSEISGGPLSLGNMNHHGEFEIDWMKVDCKTVIAPRVCGVT